MWEGAAVGPPRLDQNVMLLLKGRGTVLEWLMMVMPEGEGGSASPLPLGLQAWC